MLHSLEFGRPSDAGFGIGGPVLKPASTPDVHGPNSKQPRLGQARNLPKCTRPAN